MRRRRNPTDTTDTEWALIEPLSPLPACDTMVGWPSGETPETGDRERDPLSREVRPAAGRVNNGVMLEYLPGIGVVLPGGAGTLRFGAAPDEVRVLLTAATRVHQGMQCMSLTRADYTELRHAHDAWLSGMLFDPVWTTIATFDDLVLTVAGGGPGRPDRLARIGIDLHRPGGVSTTPVVWDGVDLFGHSAQDVVSVLPAPTRPSAQSPSDVTVEPLGLRLLRPPSAAGERWSQLVLLGAPDGWEPCCAGTFECANGGDGLVGIFR